eukprot:TRINITY_DN12053_c0_g1_i2.p1 TRINITY_DN12053_c0_g1~~TRINITY_DN12053_c0_g1_i2.p1  ORF type:complete len:744 (-),score=90.94 TRINITY_DN12053_c0_g1_i2:368-2599(-)
MAYQSFKFNLQCVRAKEPSLFQTQQNLKCDVLYFQRHFINNVRRLKRLSAQHNNQGISRQTDSMVGRNKIVHDETDNIPIQNKKSQEQNSNNNHTKLQPQIKTQKSSNQSHYTPIIDDQTDDQGQNKDYLKLQGESTKLENQNLLIDNENNHLKYNIQNNQQYIGNYDDADESQASVVFEENQDEVWLEDEIYFEQNYNNHKILELYDYQRNTIELLNESISNISRGQNRLLVEYPTGGGKSVVIAKFVEEIYKKTGWKIIVAVDAQELVQQNSDTLKKWWQEDPIEIGICCSGLYKKSFDEKVIVGSIQTMSSKKNISNFGRTQILIVDEAHKIQRDGQGRYGKFIQELTAQNPDLIIIGFTATPFRTDSGLLTESFDGQPPIFNKIVDEVTIGDLIDRNILCPMKLPLMNNKLDVKGVKSDKNDFLAESLDKNINTKDINKKIVTEINKHGISEQRKSWLIFACSIDHAQKIAKLLEDKYISVGIIVSNEKVTSKRDRRRIIDDFKNYKIQALVNVNVLTTGFDHPGLDMVVLVRPTKSKVRHIQMIGRGLRMCPGKSDCLVLDFAQNIARNGDIQTMNGQKVSKHKKTKKPKQDVIQLGEEELSELSSKQLSSEGLLTAKPAAHKLCKVEDFDIVRHMSKKKNHCLKIEWYCEDCDKSEPFKEYFTMKENNQFSLSWWKQHGGKKPPPLTMSDAEAREKEIIPFLENVSWIEIRVIQNEYYNNNIVVAKLDAQKKCMYRR